MKDQINRVRNIMNGYKDSYLLITAAQLGIFDALSDGAYTSEKISEVVSVEREKLELILNALVALGLIEKEKDIYKLDKYKAVLERKSVNSQVGYFNYAFRMADRWKNLQSVLINYGLPDENISRDQETEKAETREFLEAMNTNAIAQALYLVDKFDFAGMNIIDIGAGFGTHAMIVSDKYVDVQIDAFDLPIVQELLENNIEEVGLEKQISVIAGNYKSDLPNKKYDAVFLFSIIHQEDVFEVEKLLENIYDRLCEGGKLYLTSYFLEENRTEPCFSVMFAIEMLIRYGKGKVYTHDEIESLVAQIGYKEIQRDDSIPGPATLYIITK